MRTGVAANYVTAASQRGVLASVKEAGSSDPVCCDEEMPPPVILLKFIGDVSVGAEFAVVERQKHWSPLFPPLKTVNEANCGRL
jgi:hypothetical protein